MSGFAGHVVGFLAGFGVAWVILKSSGRRMRFRDWLRVALAIVAGMVISSAYDWAGRELHLDATLQFLMLAVIVAGGWAVAYWRRRRRDAEDGTSSPPSSTNSPEAR